MSNWVSTDSIKAYFFLNTPPKCQELTLWIFKEWLFLPFFLTLQMVLFTLSSNFLNKCLKCPGNREVTETREVMSACCRITTESSVSKRPEWKWHKITALTHKWASRQMFMHSFKTDLLWIYSALGTGGNNGEQEQRLCPGSHGDYCLEGMTKPSH